MQSGTGVYYQALPAVGPDGKNVMKLIPVRKVNGQFFHTQLLPSKNVGLPPYESPVPLPQNRVPTLQPTADGRFILKTPLKVNTVFNSVKIKPRESNEKSTTNRSPASSVTLNITQNTFPSPGKSDNKAIKKQNSPPPPNTVKAPTSQSGHFLTIPTNATVRTLPATDLPSSIKNKICQTANDSNPSKGMQMVLCVSPVSSVKLDQQAPCPTNPSEVPQTSSPTCTASVVKSPAKPEGGQGSSTPMKWVIEEREEGSAPILIPVTSTNMCSDILKAVEQMESARFPNQCAKELVSTDVRKEAVTPVDDNALVMCNGKVYLVAKKDSQVTKNMMNNAESKLQPRKSGQSLTALGPANTSKKQDPKAQADNKSPSDVIDLCDDEEENSNCTSSVGIIGPCDTDSDNDEDSNVIFVSYIPPKSSESETNKEVAQMKSLTGCVKDTESANLDTESMKTNGEINNGTDAEVEACEYEAVRVNTAALESGEASEKTDVVCRQQTHVAEKSFEETVPDPKHQPKSDSELRRAFGIAFDLSVSLQKIDVSDETQAVQPTSERRLINKRTLDSSRELIHHSNIETKIKPPIQAQLTKPVKNGKRKRLDNNEENDFNTFNTSNSDYEIESATAEQSRAGQVLQTCQAGQGNKSSTSGAGDTDLLCFSSLVEPPQAQSGGPDCLGLRKTPHRSSKGCGRVCTACPCGTKVGGVAGNSASNLREKPNPSSSVNSSKSVQNKSNRKAAPATTCGSLSENRTTGSSRSHVSKNVTDAVTTADVLTGQSAATVTYSGCTHDQTSINSILQTDAQKPDIPNWEKNVSSSAHQFSYTSDGISNELYSELLDPEEIKRQERIKRLKDLLREKEAALEKLRRSM